MSISSSGGFSFGPVVAVAQPQTGAANGLTKVGSSTAVQDFLAYLKESPAQRMEDSWLAGHGLTRAKLAAMSPDQRAAVLKQMATDIENQLKQQAAEQAGGKLGARNPLPA